jgi:hypothetical protein
MLPGEAGEVKILEGVETEMEEMGGEAGLERVMQGI